MKPSHWAAPTRPRAVNPEQSGPFQLLFPFLRPSVHKQVNDKFIDLGQEASRPRERVSGTKHNGGFQKDLIWIHGMTRDTWNDAGQITWDNTWNFKQGNGMKSCTDIGGEALETD